MAGTEATSKRSAQGTRWWRHLATDDMIVRRLFGREGLTRIQQAVAEGERRHRGQLRFAVEPALPLRRVVQGVTPRERALEVFSLSRTWDTEDNCGVLVYLLIADRKVEIVADRGIHRRVGNATWEAICRTMESAFRAGKFEQGALAGLREISDVLALHFPAEGGERPNELPDAPIVL
ncbi:MAG TPA: TPM domain-containing protein [Casimicrobiaceae bacterium]|nr:TPM domain-containing protein [Casimicrobiaceae bacterium]